MATFWEVPECDDRFTVVQEAMDWHRVGYWEAIFSLSNGLLGVRGSFDERMEGLPGRPMTFMAGFYDTAPKGLPELPMLPEWLAVDLTLAGSPFDLRLGSILSFKRWLDLRRGLLLREVVWRDLQGRSTRVRFLRCLHLVRRYLALVQMEVTPLDWSGTVELKTGLAPPPWPGRRDPHWNMARLWNVNPDMAQLWARTRQTRRPLAAACHTCGFLDGRDIAPQPRFDDHGVGTTMTLEIESGQTCTFDRFTTFVAGGAGEKPPATTARQRAREAADIGCDNLLKQHTEACKDLWRRHDIEIDGPAEQQRAIRYNLFQLATLCPRPGDFASIGPKGLSGTHYLGHIFWDTEIYMLPMFALTDPDGARTLLDYRYQTLDGARAKARSNGYGGAQYAWESADTGEEACPKALPHPITGEPVRIFCGDIQDHISADVPYAVNTYVQATGDREYLWTYGAEIVFETARFWTTRVTPNAAGGYEIRDALGPDEFHVHVNNDMFTNMMARAALRYAAELYDDAEVPVSLKQFVIDRIRLNRDEPVHWREVAEKLTMLIDSETGFVHQHEGFTDRPDLAPELFALEHRRPLSEIIGADVCVQGQALKQAEVVALLHLLPDEFDRKAMEINFDYYEPRTTHDSSLSFSSHSLAASLMGRIETAYDYLKRSIFLDLDDLAGNTAHGLHTANMGGMWQAIVFGLAGLEFDGDSPTINPRLPAEWKSLRFAIRHRGRGYTITCGHYTAGVQLTDPSR